MTKEDVLAQFDLDIQRMEPKMGESTTEDLKKTVKRLIINDRLGVIEALRYWLRLRDVGLTLTAVILIWDAVIPELKPDVICLKKEIESGKIFHSSYLYLVDKALEVIS